MELFAGTVPANYTLFAGNTNQTYVRMQGWGRKTRPSFFLYCMPRQHPAQNASTQRHVQPASTDI